MKLPTQDRVQGLGIWQCEVARPFDPSHDNAAEDRGKGVDWSTLTRLQ